MAQRDPGRSVAVCTALNGPRSIRFERWPMPVPIAGEALVRIEACGVNFPDLLMTRDRYQLHLTPPFVPGMEACGIIEALGPGTIGFAVGDRVIAHARAGLYASHVAMPVATLSPAPPNFSAAESACFRVAALTAWHALADRAALQPGERVLVLGGSGGVSLAAIEIAKLMGAHVIAAASSREKCAAAKNRGADEVIDYSTTQWVEGVRAIAPDGVDVVFDPVGGDVFDQAARLLAWNGRMLVVGFASGRIPELRVNLPLIKGYAVLGVRAGESMRRNPALRERADRQLAAWTDVGRLHPLITQTLPLAEAAAALELLEKRKVIGRIALIPEY